ncbi:MAG: hypothetical protein JWN13_611 [Betaproteobacteria bacterium]|jgi:tripartite-type tricarboxylate transporter receptor subunit TctC|nr:hypothetical protein [Betaproteobacteria bacterium]
MMRCAALLAVLLAPTAPDALAQIYPVKPIRVLVAYPAGGANDIVARAVGARSRSR